MSGTKHLRRLPGTGWELREGAEVVAIRLDTGELLRPEGEMLGVREAAALLGVRPPNFVRDWASRPDFPAPAATLSSGRVWRGAEVREYAARRRAAAPTRGSLAEVARHVAWWDDPERVWARPRVFIARVLARGTAKDVQLVEAAFGRAAMRAVVEAAPAGLFDARGWHYWRLVLDLPLDTPLPARRSA